MGNPSALYWATGTEVPFASFNAATNSKLISGLKKIIDFTDVVDYCTAEILKTWCVADQAESCHFTRDLQK